MKLLNKRRNSAAAQERAAEPVKISAANWTRGQQMATTATRVALWGLIACAPLGLGIGAAAFATATQPLPRAASAGPTEATGRIEATGIAEHAVMTWLSATRETEGQTEGLAPKADLPAKALDVSNASAVSSEFDGSAWVVTVGVTITSILPAADDASKPQPLTQRRYFQIPIAVDGSGQATVLTLPAEVAGPSLAAVPAASYRATLPPIHPAAVAAGEFLTALLAGGGDITRYTSPGSQIRPVTPAPYSQVVVEQVTTDTLPAEKPTDGDTTTVMVRARATDATDATTRFDYVLELTVRASRWEITRIKGAPPVPPDQESSAIPEPVVPVTPTNP